MNDIVYIADLDQDIDDMIAIEYLFNCNRLKYVVVDSDEENELIRSRISFLKQKGIVVSDKIEDGKNIVFVGGSLKKVRFFLERNEQNKIKLLVMNGGFVGANIVPIEKQLDKFKYKTHARTYNFNLDVNSTDFVLNSSKVDILCLIGKNVCHHPMNSKKGIWNEFESNFELNFPKKKLLHDLLMVSEGLRFVDKQIDSLLLDYEFIHVVKDDFNKKGKHTTWGSELAKASRVLAATNWKNLH